MERRLDGSRKSSKAKLRNYEAMLYIENPASKRCVISMIKTTKNAMNIS
jgi:hypothetical protein